MSRTHFILFAVSIFAANAALAGSRENYLPNPGFEQDWKFWYNVPAPNGVVSIDDKVSHSGNRSLRLQYNSSVDARLPLYLWASNTIGAVLVPGHVYTFSGWIKIAGVPPDKNGPVAYLCEAHSDRGTSTMVTGNTDPTKNNGWVFVKHRYEAPKEAGAHQFRCQCHAPPGGAVGTVWFDDLKIEEGEAASDYRPDWIDFTEHYSYEPNIPWLPVPLDFRSSLEVVTPHVELARGYAGGTPRMLWAGFYNNARVGCELAERDDITLDSVVFNGSSVDMTGIRILHERCVEMFRTRLGLQPALPANRAVQVLVIEQGTLEILDRADRSAIVDLIAQGMGCVVLLGPIHSPEPGHPGAVATTKIQELVRAAESLTKPGHGRVVIAMNAMQNPLWGHGTLGIESSYNDILQAIYASIGRPGVAVSAASWPQKPIAGKPWSAIVTGKAPIVRCRIIADLPVPSSSLNDGYGVSAPRTIVAETYATANGNSSNETRVAMRPLTSGKYMLLAQSLDESKQVTGWTIAPFTVESSVEITKLDGGAATFIPNQPLHIQCTIKNYYRALPNARIATQITDPAGRILAVSSVPVSIAEGQTTQDVAVTLMHAEHSAVELHVYIEVGSVRHAQASLWISTEKLMPKIDFHVGPYDDYYDGWRALGADMSVGPPIPSLGLRPYLWIDLFKAMGPKHSCCDLDSIEKGTKYVAASLASMAPWTTVGCILHDELDSYGFSSPDNYHEVEFFRQYLRDTYKDLRTLNASWGTSYSDWRDINAEPTKINFTTQSDRNPAPWADWQTASEMAAHKFYSAMDQAARQVNPALRVGPSGTRNTTGVNGADWWLLAHDFRSICFYPGVHNEMYRSFAPDGNLMSNWSHLDALDDSDALRVRIWQDVLAHCGGTPVYGGRYINVFFPDYRPKPGLPAYAAELAEIRRGYGRLILGARRNDAAVAIFYSPASYRARIVAMKDTLIAKADAVQNNMLASLSAALADARIGSHFIAYEQVANGELDPKKTKVLFLWGTLAMSAREATAVRKYLNAGGIVIADSEPGLYDEHCHRLAVGPFHDCLPQGNEAALKVGQGKFIVYRDLDDKYVVMRGYQYEGAPAPPASSTPETSDALLRSSTKLKTMLAKQTGVEPGFRLCDDHDKDFAHSFTAFDYVDGAARYVACVPEGVFGHTLDARLTIAGQGHLYECRSGKYLGLATGTHELKLQASTANLFAVLPYRIQRLDLAASAETTLGQAVEFRAKLAIAGAPLARHIVVVQMRLPNGHEMPEHRLIVETANGLAEGRLYLALNDPFGKYTITAKDIATGVQATMPVVVQAAR